MAHWTVHSFVAPDANVSRFWTLLQRSSALGVLAECQSLHRASLSQPVEVCWGSQEFVGSSWNHWPCACCLAAGGNSYSLCVCHHVQGTAGGVQGMLTAQAAMKKKRKKRLS